MNLDASLFYDLLLLLLHVNTTKTKALADELFTILNDQDSSLSSSDLNYINLYVSLCKDIIAQQLTVVDNKSDISNLIIRYLNNKIFKRDKLIRNTLRDILKSKVTASRIAELTEKLNNLVTWFKSSRYITKLYGNMKECSLAYTADEQTEKINEMKDLVTGFKNSMMEIDSVIGRGGPIEKIDFSKKDSIKNAYELFQERHVTHVLKTGLQGLNKMCGSRGGFALGESVLFAALQHNFKSGMLMNIVRWISDYSSPPKIPNKKPLILMITLENIGYMNMMDMFKQMFATLNGAPPPEDMSDDDVVNNIYEYFNRGEYTLVIERYLPSTFGYDEFVRLIEKYENSGYKVVATVVDYLSKMKKGNGAYSKAGGHELLQELFNGMCNYCKAVGTTLFSAAQLNRGASDIVGTGMRHPVKQFSERHLAGSIDIGREVDFLCYMNIERDEKGQSWLTMQWGKHRYVNDTPESSKFACYKFELNGIPDDVNGTNNSVKDIYIGSDKDSRASADDIKALLGGV